MVKAAFVPFSATGENPANAGAARLCGVSPHPAPDTATALPKQARYQLRYTRLLSFLSGWSYSPKPGAIPTSPHPDIHFSAMIPRRVIKIKFFLSVVIPVVKAAFMPLSAIGESPANAGVTRLSGVSHYSIPDTATALPRQARYQLRYTRLYIAGLSDRPHSIPYSAPVFKSFLHRRPQKVVGLQYILDN